MNKAGKAIMKNHLWNKVLKNVPVGSMLAFDVNVSDREIGQFARKGYRIVCCCLETEEDESFIGRAYAAGATHIFSQDADIGNIIEKENYDMIWVRHGKFGPNFS